MKFNNPVQVDFLRKKVFSKKTNFNSKPTEKKEYTGISLINNIEKGDITFVDNYFYLKKILAYKNVSSVLILTTNDLYMKVQSVGLDVVVCESPFFCFSEILSHFFSPQSSNLKKKESVNNCIYYEGDNVHIGNNTRIGMNVVIGSGSVIGSNCIIMNNVVINERTVIGDDVIINHNSVLGCDPFYYKKEGKKHIHISAVGNVSLGDFVTIGCNCTIERGVASTTVISKNCAVGHQVLVGHGSKIGESNLIVGQSGISGKVTTEENVLIRGQSGVDRGIHIGKNAIVHGKSGVTRNVEEGSEIVGYRGFTKEQEIKNHINIRKIPSLISRLKTENKATEKKRIKEKVIKIAEETLCVNLSDDITLKTSFNTLGDSLDMTELYIVLEAHFDIELGDYDSSIEHVDDLVSLVSAKVNS